MAAIKHDIFLSYSSKDANRVKPIVALLEAQGWQVWWDPKIPHGTRFDTYIEEQLNQSRIVVVVWSKDAVNSNWVRAEANDGESRNVLFPIKIDEVVPPLIFRALQTTNLVGWNREEENTEVQKLLASIQQKLLQKNEHKPAQEKVKGNPKNVIQPIVKEVEKNRIDPNRPVENGITEGEPNSDIVLSETMKKVSGVVLFLALIAFFYTQFQSNEPKILTKGLVPEEVSTAIEKEIPSIKIGNQIWMAKNLNIKVDSSFCYDNNPANCKKYGQLYTWEAAKIACPKGWHLPTDIEWKTLLDNVGGYYDWDNGEEVGDSKKGYQALSGKFVALFGGVRSSDGAFSNLDKDGNYWSATEKGAGNPWYYYFNSNDGKVGRHDFDKEKGFSCRCLKD